MNLQPFVKNLRVILLTGLVIRILFAFSYDTGDTGAFCHAGELLLQRKEVYADPTVYFSGPPFALHVTAAMNWLGDKLRLPCSGMWKMPTIFADIGIGWIIYFIAKNELKQHKAKAIRMAMFYMYNPIAIFVSGFQGQQESFWLFFILLAWLLIQRYQKIVWAGISAGVAFAYKIPVVLVLSGLFFLVRGWKQRILFTALIGFIFVFSLFPEIVTSRPALIRQSFLYSSIPGIWGVTGLVNKALAFSLPLSEKGVAIASTILKVVIIGFSLVIYRNYLKESKRNFFQLCLNMFMMFLVFTPGFGPQYLLWLIPFLILLRHPFYLLYTLLVTFAFLHTYGLAIPPMDLILVLLQKYVYNKIHMVYPYDLYYPVWILLTILFLKKENKLPKWITSIRNAL